MDNRHRKRKKLRGIREVGLLMLSVAAMAAAMAWTVPATGPTIISTMGPEIETKQEDPEKTYIGQFTVTAYCSCEICCGKWANKRPNGIIYTASGAEAKNGETVGAAWDVLPVGTRIEIDGLGERIVQDKPADWIVERYEGRILDVYFGSHEAALEYGKHTVDVWIIEDGKEE